jgi:DNA-binding phage protein
LEIPAGTFPLVATLMRHINAADLTLTSVAARAGIERKTLRRMRKHAPRLDLFLAALNAVGLDLKITRKGS